LFAAVTLEARKPSEHPCKLKLVLGRVLEQLADATGCRAYAIHESLIVFALFILSPTLATLVMVHTHSRANSARVRAFLHNRKWVVHALASISPNLALSAVIVSALDPFTNSAAQRAVLEHEARVLVAFAISRPARAVVLHVTTGGLACLTRYWAIADHVLGIFVAFARSTPTRTVSEQILTLWRAETAASGADTQHGVRIRLAFAGFGPCTTGCIRVVARV